MSKIIGTATTAFDTKDGKRIEGTTVYTVEPIDPKRGTGEAGDHFFLSKAKLAALDFKPAVGQTVEEIYNKYGKIQTLRLLDDELI